MIRSLLCLLLTLPALAASYYPWQLPSTTSASGNALVWIGTNLYQIGVTNLVNAVARTNGTAYGLTLSDTIDSDAAPLYLDSANNRVGINGTPSWSLDVYANAVTWGADDGAYTTVSRTSSTAKDLGFRMFDYNNSYFGFLRAQSSSGNNTLTLGYNAGSEKGANRLDFALAANNSATSATTVGRMTSSGLILGGTSKSSTALLQLDSTSQVFLPPRMTTAEFAAIGSKVAGSIGYSTTSNRVVVHNGSADKYLVDSSDLIAGYQPLSGELTAISALNTAAFGRSLLTNGTASTARANLDAQQLNSELTAIAALSTTSYGRALLTIASAVNLRNYIELSETNSPRFETIELGNASDTTLARSAAGRVTVEGVPVALTPSVETLTYSSTTVTVTAGKGPLQLSELTCTNNFTLAFSSLASGDGGTIVVWPAATNCTVTLSSYAYGPSGTTLTITGGTGNTNYTELAWKNNVVGGTNRVSVNALNYYR